MSSMSVVHDVGYVMVSMRICTEFFEAASCPKRNELIFSIKFAALV